MITPGKTPNSAGEIITQANNGDTNCTYYCNGVNGGSWGNELPREWNGAECVRTTNGTPCGNRTPGRDLGCVCRGVGTVEVLGTRMPEFFRTAYALIDKLNCDPVGDAQWSLWCLGRFCLAASSSSPDRFRETPVGPAGVKIRDTMDWPNVPMFTPVEWL